ncbi:MAG: hypothetical protein CVU39_15165 [Chloroflexi bacterium HGW-Chloroflexi-10]|nr:MAG: hypothetical protein CVU39_15165 [Chloroflexi bacterium HGW-Chloroflexi-10]
MNDQLRNLVAYATQAANGHNTQPWKFTLQKSAIQIHPDYSRHLVAVDPQDRELWISLGCALENLVLAAGAAGYTTEVTYPDTNEFIQVILSAGASQNSPLFEAIPLRQNTRSMYNSQAIPTGDLDTLQTLSLEPGISLKYFTNINERQTVEDYIVQGNMSQYADQAFLNELIEWLRFNKKEALRAMDGLFSACSGNPEVPHWLGKLFVSSTKPQQQADSDTAKLRSSSGVVVIGSAEDDRSHWVRSGQVYQRLALQMTTMNIKSAFLNQPIEVTDLRKQFQNAAGLGSTNPQLLVRYGYAEYLPRSLRRPVDKVLMQAS